MMCWPRFWICRALESFVRNAPGPRRAAQAFLLRRRVVPLALNLDAALWDENPIVWQASWPRVMELLRPDRVILLC